MVVNNLRWMLGTELKFSTVTLSLQPHDFHSFPDEFVASWGFSITKIGILFLPILARVLLLFGVSVGRTCSYVTCAESSPMLRL